jgi:hypothetical protein
VTGANRVEELLDRIRTIPYRCEVVTCSRPPREIPQHPGENVSPTWPTGVIGSPQWDRWTKIEGQNHSHGAKSVPSFQEL